MKLTGAQIIMECLLEQGVDTIFGYPGGAVLNTYDALYHYQHRIRHITTAHEQAAAHAADGYARRSGKTGVCLATSGPGATNLVTGIATAFMDSSPVVALTGNVNVELLGKSSFQEVDIVSITRPVTRKSSIVYHVEELAERIREAFALANEGRKGPVLVDIPKNVTAQSCEFVPQPPKRPCKLPAPSKDKLDKALQLLQNSRRPLLYTGGGVIAAEASLELAEFAKRLQAPVSSSLMCQGGFDQHNPYYIGMLGMHGTKVSSQAIAECDLLVAVGTRFSDRVTCNTDLFARHCPILQIDIDPKEFAKNVHCEVELLGDVREILSLLNANLPPQEHTEWMDRVLGWEAAYPLRQMESSGGVTPQLILQTLDELTQSSAVLTTEVGQHQMWAAQFYSYRHPRQLITSGGLGTMGFGLGAAIGAKLADPGKTVVNIAGDGSFHMNANELSTLAKYQIPVIELLFDNRVLGMVRQWQKLFYDSRFSETDLNKPTNYEALANAYGIEAMTIRWPQDVKPVLSRALALSRPVLVHCMIDPDANVLPMVPAGDSVEHPIFEL